MTVCLTSEERCCDREPLVARASEDSHYWLVAWTFVPRTWLSQWCWHAYLFCVLPHSFFLGKDRPLAVRYMKHHHKALLVSNPTEKVHASWHDKRGAIHTRNEFNTEKKPNSLISYYTFIYLVQTIQHNSPFDVMVCFFLFALKSNPTRLPCCFSG